MAILAALVGVAAGDERSSAQASPQNELAAAAAAERSGQYEEAARHYQKFLSANAPSPASPTMIEARTRLAKAYFLLHRYQESLRALEPLPFGASDVSAGGGAASSKRSALRKSSPASAIPAQAWLVRGLDDLELNQLSDAIRSLRQTLVLDPSSGTARLALGDAQARSDHLEEAADAYREQLRRAPNVADAWYKLGFVYTQLAQKLGADFARKRANTVLALQLTAEQLSDRGDYWGAAQTLFPVVHTSRLSSGQETSNQAANQRPKSAESEASAFHPGLHGDFGTALLELGYPSAAAGEFRTELSQDPGSLLALLGMAQVEALGSNWDGALDIFGRVMVLYPAELTRRLQSPPSAALSDAWRQGKAAVPPRLAETPGGKLWMLWLRNAGLESPPPIKSAQTECSSHPSNTQREPGYWIAEACSAQLRQELTSRKGLSEAEGAKLVEIDYRLGYYEESRNHARTLLRSAPNAAWANYWLVKSYSALAGQCFEKLAELNPDSARVHEILARYDSERHQLVAARNEYEAALRLAPELPDLHLGLGTVCWQAGDWERAEDELTKALRLSPGSAVAAYELGDSYIQQHQWQKAMDYLERALADPAVERKARLDLAKAEAELGQTGAAIKDLSLLAADDRDGEIHYRLAMLYRKTGEAPKAQEALASSEALRKASDHLDLQQLEALERERGNLQDFGPTVPK